VLGKGESFSDYPTLEHAYKNVWADNGDTLSMLVREHEPCCDKSTQSDLSSAAAVIFHLWTALALLCVWFM
jgi:hypothetical protein